MKLTRMFSKTQTSVIKQGFAYAYIGYPYRNKNWNKAIRYSCQSWELGYIFLLISTVDSMH